MTIIGLGIDATDIPRLRETYQKYGERFLRRVFTDAEIAYCLKRRDPAPHLAGRFAAKEAGMKAIGTGQSHGVLWRDVEVVRRGGPPRLEFHGAALGHAERLGVKRALLSITHSQALAFAEVILLGEPGT